MLNNTTAYCEVSDQPRPVGSGTVGGSSTDHACALICGRSSVSLSAVTSLSVTRWPALAAANRRAAPSELPAPSARPAHRTVCTHAQLLAAERPRPKSIKAGSRILYRREDIEHWLAEVDGRNVPTRYSASGWFTKATEAAEWIDPGHTAPWKLASTYAPFAIAEALLTQRAQKPAGSAVSRASDQPDGEMLTVADVAAMTRLSMGTLRYWRHAGSGAPPSGSRKPRVSRKLVKIQLPPTVSEPWDRNIDDGSEANPNLDFKLAVAGSADGRYQGAGTHPWPHRGHSHR